MQASSPPKYIRQILTTLQARGHLACLVGGCVRDMYLGQRPQDWDICTSALPEQVMEIFPHTVPTGLKHGTVTVLIGSRKAEVTTFRSESGYADHRHPDNVFFVGDLTTDLSRRDFTINAIALPPDGLVIDPFGGREDLAAGLIRCVGEPERRFEEDALRMFRALRFSARFGFAVEEATMAAIYAKAPLAAGLSGERVRDEIEKLLLTRQPAQVGLLIETGLLDHLLPRRAPEGFSFAALSRVPRRPQPRWAAFCALLEQAGCLDGVEDFLRALRLDRQTEQRCLDTLRLLALPAPASDPAWKRQLRDYGVDAVTCAAVCRDAIHGGHSRAALRAVLKSGECFHIRYLAVSGEDLLALGFEGKALGEMLDFLLDYVIDFPANNRRELLLALARSSEE